MEGKIVPIPLPLNGQAPGLPPSALPPPRGYTPGHLVQKNLTSRHALEGKRRLERFDQGTLHAVLARVNLIRAMAEVADTIPIL
jgi:hypothetical protein